MKSAVSRVLPRALFALMAGVCLGGSLQAQSDEDFRNALNDYLSGRQEEALQGFRAILADDPSNEDALRYLDVGGREVFMLMLDKEGEYEATALRFLQLARVARKDKTDDEGAISALVDQAMTGNYLDRRDALLTLSADHGEYGAAPFVEFLGNEDDPNTRVDAIYCLTRMSGDAVLPLIAALGSESDLQVANAAACLGAIRDVRAVPALRRAFEAAGSERARDVCDDALRKITGQSAASLPAAADLFVGHAVEYFSANDTVVSPFDTKDAVWSLEDGSAVAEKVPAALRSLRLAEQNCRSALENPRAQAVLLASLAAQKASVMHAEEGDIENSEELVAGIDVALATGGPRGLSAALGFSLGADAPHAAVQLIGALEATGQGNDALSGCLSSPYKSVRYHAAFALARSGNTGSEVTAALVQALGEDAIRTVLVVDPDSSSRNALAEMLRGAGLAVVTADSGALGFARSRTLPAKDCIIVRAGLSDVTLDQFIYDSDFRTESSPMLILGDEASKDSLESMYDGKGKVAGFLTTPLTADTLVSSVEAAMGEMNDERTSALDAAVTAAGILSHLPSVDLAGHEGGLAAALARTDESVLVPVLGAISNLGAASALAPTAALFADGGNSEAVRVAAASAMGGIFRHMSQSPGVDMVDALVAAAASDDSLAVRVAAGQALGQAGFLTDAERAAILKGGTN